MFATSDTTIEPINRSGRVVVVFTFKNFTPRKIHLCLFYNNDGLFLANY